MIRPVRSHGLVIAQVDAMQPPSRFSRRHFIGSAAAGAATVWIPAAARGYTSAEMRALAANEKATGVSKWDLDTPALCVDLDKLKQNLATMRTRPAQKQIVSRPHGKTHKCPAIAKLQLAAGSVGICAAKVSEAEVFAANGIDRILMTTANHTPVKIRRAMQIRSENPQFGSVTEQHHIASSSRR